MSNTDGTPPAGYYAGGGRPPGLDPTRPHLPLGGWTPGSGVTDPVLRQGQRPPGGGRLVSVSVGGANRQAAGGGIGTVAAHIQLKARKFDLVLDFLYSPNNPASTEYGAGRAASVRGQAVSAGGGQLVTLVRGDFREFSYSRVGSTGGITTFVGFAQQGATNTLTFDGSTFVEYFSNGMQMRYQAQTGGGSPVTYQLASVADASGVAQTYSYGSGAEAGLLQTIEVPGGLLVTFVYAAGVGTSLLNSVQDWGGRVWTFQYDAHNNLTTLTTPLGCINQYTYSLAGSTTTQLYTTEDSRGYVTTYLYDSDQRVTTMTAGGGVWTWAYNVGTQQTNVVRYTPAGAATTYNYGTDGYVDTEQRPEGYTVTYTYASNGFRTKSQIPSGTTLSVTYDPNLWLITASDDSLGHRTTLQYDGYGNLTTLVDANGATSTFGYAGNGSTYLRIRQTDPLGRVSLYSYTYDGLLQSITDPRGLTTSFNYDTFGNVASMVASDATVTTYQYDVLNRLIAVTDPLNRTTTYAYDPGDNLISTTDPTAATTTLIYSNCLVAGGGRSAEPPNELHLWSLLQCADRDGCAQQHDHAELRCPGLPDFDAGCACERKHPGLQHGTPEDRRPGSTRLPDELCVR